MKRAERLREVNELKLNSLFLNNVIVTGDVSDFHDLPSFPLYLSPKFVELQDVSEENMELFRRAFSSINKIR